jgi:hypothetical protein
MQATCTAAYQSCNGNSHYFYDETSAATWSSSNTAVATIDGSAKGLVHAIAVGKAGINGTYTGWIYHFTPSPPHCSETSDTVSPGEQATVATPSYYVNAYGSAHGTVQCKDPAGQTRNMPALTIYYQVLTSSKAAVPGATVTEQLSWTSSACATSNTCEQKPSPATWTADSNAAFADTIYNCSPTCVGGGECTEAWQQTFTVEGLPAGIISGNTTGVENCVSVDCNTGASDILH